MGLETPPCHTEVLDTHRLVSALHTNLCPLKVTSYYLMVHTDKSFESYIYVKFTQKQPHLFKVKSLIMV